MLTLFRLGRWSWICLAGQGLGVWAGKDEGGLCERIYEREVQLFALHFCPHFLIVAKLHNKVFVSNKCPSSFLNPAGAWPGVGGQGVEWESKAEGREEEAQGGSRLTNTHSFSMYLSCTHSVLTLG